MVFHDEALQLLQFEASGSGIKMLSYNELAPTSGILEGGRIVNMDAFDVVLEGLFSQSQPVPVQTKELYVTVPYRLLYTYVEDFSHKASESALKESILETVRKHFPVPVEELVLDFDLTEKGHKTSYAVSAWPKKWKERILKSCQTVGISSVKFIPEPLCLKALSPDSTEGDIALFSSHGKEVYLSLFHNGLLYDSYFLALMNGEEESGVDFQAEFEKAQKDFEARFDVKIQTIGFVGFEDNYQKSIRAGFADSKLELEFFGAKQSALREVLPYQVDRSTLFGLFNFVRSREE